jgi:hypothetical protein
MSDSGSTTQNNPTQSSAHTSASINIKLPKTISGWAAFLFAAGGTVGTILTALNVGGLAAPTNEILQGISGVLLWISAHHVTKAATTK